MKYLKIFEEWGPDEQEEWKNYENSIEPELDPFNLGPFEYGGIVMITNTEKVFKGNDSIKLYFYEAGAHFKSLYNTNDPTDPSKPTDYTCNIEKYFDDKKRKFGAGRYILLPDELDQNLTDFEIVFRFKHKEYTTHNGVKILTKNIRTIDLKLEIPIYDKGEKIFVNEHAEVEFSGMSHMIFASEEESNKFKQKVLPILKKCPVFQESFSEFMEYSTPAEWKKLMKMLNDIKLY